MKRISTFLCGTLAFGMILTGCGHDETEVTETDVIAYCVAHPETKICNTNDDSEPAITRDELNDIIEIQLTELCTTKPELALCTQSIIPQAPEDPGTQEENNSLSEEEQITLEQIITFCKTFPWEPACRWRKVSCSIEPENPQCIYEPGEFTGVYDRVLIISRTDDDGYDGACRAPNPGPDIDYVKYVANGGVEAFPVAVDGQHGGFCGSQEMESGDWAPIEVIELQTSLQDDGTCDTNNSIEKYFFMGIGQPQADGETLAVGTGYVVVSFEDEYKNAVNLKNDGVLTVVEINKIDNDGEVMCSNVDKDRQNDAYDVYIIAKDAAITAGTTKISAPEFIRVTPNSAVGLYTHVITELPEAADNNDNENGGVIGD